MDVKIIIQAPVGWGKGLILNELAAKYEKEGYHCLVKETNHQEHTLFMHKD